MMRLRCVSNCVEDDHGVDDAGDETADEDNTG
jgi:hypothetical protein